jgi:hypothetical protein
MREQARRAIGALIVALCLAVSGASSAAAGGVSGAKSESAAELLLLTMLLAAAMTAPAEPATATAQLVEEAEQGSAQPQIACAAPARPECSPSESNAW